MQSNSKTIHLPIPPPPGFEPISASNAELLKHGLPPRPDPKSCPQLYATWHRVLSLPLTFVSAQPKPLPPSEYINRIPIHVAAEDSGQDYESPIWSGAVNTKLPSLNYKFTQVSGSWAVPRAYPRDWAWTGSGWSTSSIKNSNRFTSGTWVGIDGYHTSRDVLQAGTAQKCIVNDDGTLTHITYPWFEWYPDGPNQLEGFHVNSGESVTVQVGSFEFTFEVFGSFKTIVGGLVFFCNESNFTYTSVIIAEPENATLVGDTVEWIIEGHKPKHPAYPSMSYLGTTFINECIAIAKDPKDDSQIVEKNLKDARLLEIVQQGKLLSYGEKENDRLLGIYSGKRKLPNDVLLDGLYKIEYVPEPSLHAYHDGDSVIASELTSSTWLVKSVDPDKKLYTIQLVEQLSYWFPQKTLVKKNTTVNFVKLKTEYKWRLIQDRNSAPGAYFIESPVESSQQGDTQLVEVKDSGNNYDQHGEPLVVISVNSVGPDSPSWRFIPVIPQA